MTRRPDWHNVALTKGEDANMLASLAKWKSEMAAHLINTGRIPAPETGFRVILATNRINVGIIGYAYSPLPREKEPSERERLQKELEETRIELERLKKAAAAKPRLLKS